LVVVHWADAKDRASEVQGPNKGNKRNADSKPKLGLVAKDICHALPHLRLWASGGPRAIAAMVGG
jgi:hypothetical protein